MSTTERGGGNKTKSQTGRRAASAIDHEPVIALRLYGSHYEVPLPPHRDRFLVGAAEHCDVRVMSEFASAEHCEIVRTADGLVVHNRSKNGTWIFGQAQASFALRANTIFDVGGRTLVAVSAWAQLVRQRFQRWLGYGEAFQPSVDEAVQAAARRRHLLIAGAPGTQAQQLAHAIHEAWLPVARPFVVVERVSGDRAMQRRILQPAVHGSLLVPADGLPADPSFILELCREEAMNVRIILVAPPSAEVNTSILGAGLRDGMAYVRIPSLRERIGDLPQLVAVVAREVAASLDAVDASIIRESAALYTHPWPNNLDELEYVLRCVLAIRKHGSLRDAATAIGAKRSTVSERLSKMGIKVGK